MLTIISQWKVRRYLTPVPLRLALTVPFVLLIVGATWLVGYLSYLSGQTAVETLGQQLIQQTNVQVAQELKNYLQTPLLVNRLNIALVDQGYLNPQDLPALETALFNRLRQFEQISASLFISPEGRLRAIERFPNYFLVSADPPQTDSLRVYELNEQGKPQKLVHEVKNFDIRRDRPFYQRAVTTGQAGWSPITRYGNSNALTLDASQPVYDRTTRKLLGVFAVHLRLDYLSKFLRSLAIAQAGQVLITDENGSLIATSTNEEPYTFGDKLKAPNQFYQFKVAQSQNELTRSLGEYLQTHPNALATADQSQLLEFRHRSEQHYIQITPFRDQYGLNLRIISVIPESYFLAAIQNNTRTTITLCLLTLGTAIALGLLAGRLLTQRFAQLRQVSRSIAQGDLDRRLPLDSRIEELNDLSETYNQMADQLQDSFDRIRNALADSQEKFTIIFRTSPEPAAIASFAEGRILEVNDSLLQFFGYLSDEVLDKTALDLQFWHNPDQREQYKALLTQHRSVRNLEVQVLTKSGSIKTVLLSAEVLTLEGQDRVIMMQRDISDRKAIELALEQSEARYRAIVEDQIDLIARSLPDTTLTFVNGAFCRYFDVQPEEVLGKSFYQMIYEADRPEVMQRISTLSRANPMLVMENRNVAKGQVRWMQWSDRLLFDEQGDVKEFQMVGRDITELKKTEEALRKSEARLLQAQQISHLGSWELDPVTGKLIWSEELFRIVGLDPSQGAPSRAELSAMNLFAEDTERLETAVDRAIEQNIPYEIEHQFHRPDGTVRTVISKGQPIFAEQEQRLKLYGTVLDITDRKQSEAALQQSEARLSIAQRVAQIGIWEWDIATQKRTWSELTYQQWGRDPALGNPSYDEVLQMVHPDDRNIVQIRNNAAIAQGMPYSLTLRVLHSDGSIRYLDSRVEPLCDEQGQVYRLLGTSIDITELKRIETALRESEERFRRAFNGAPIGMSLVSLTGRFVRVNRTYCDLMGYTEEELLTRTFRDLTHPADKEEDWQGFQQMLNGEISTFQMQKRYITKQGEAVPVLLSTAPLRDETGKVLYVVAHIQDIRDRLKVDRMKDEFISVVSHELRTPLTSIRGALGILASGVFHDRPAQADQMLKIALNNSDRLVRLVNDILTLERLQSGKVPLIKESCQVSDLIQQAIDSVRALADQSSITLSVTSVPATIVAAPDAIVQTLTNLLSNAIKFSDSGSTVWIHAEQHEDPSHFCFMVKDQGRGIPEDKLEMIFEQFQQVDVSDSRQKGGTGLGLAICKKIVQEHTGEIWVESRLGEGSTFYFVLPFTK
ncbi:PAS domain S-box protein [Leptolyngbya sp. AN03gr2]|uniref:PAS domain S-box protein n=1 Tax=unclassified Leptolyngbya TaxID=2650499 RepID=UPI003D31CD11